MKLIRKSINAIIEAGNEGIKKTINSIPGDYRDIYYEGVKMPLIDDDASPEELIECMYAIFSMGSTISFTNLETKYVEVYKEEYEDTEKTDDEIKIHFNRELLTLAETIENINIATLTFKNTLSYMF